MYVVVCHDHAFLTVDNTDTCYQVTSRHSLVMSRQHSDLKERATTVNQRIDSIPGIKFAFLLHFLALTLRNHLCLFDKVVQFAVKSQVCFGVFLVLLRVDVVVVANHFHEVIAEFWEPPLVDLVLELVVELIVLQTAAMVCESAHLLLKKFACDESSCRQHLLF